MVGWCFWWQLEDLEADMVALQGMRFLDGAGGKHSGMGSLQEAGGFAGRMWETLGPCGGRENCWSLEALWGSAVS